MILVFKLIGFVNLDSTQNTLSFEGYPSSSLPDEATHKFLFIKYGKFECKKDIHFKTQPRYQLRKCIS